MQSADSFAARALAGASDNPTGRLARALCRYYLEGNFAEDLAHLQRQAPDLAAYFLEFTRQYSAERLHKLHAVYQSASTTTRYQNTMNMEFVRIDPSQLDGGGRFRMGSHPDDPEGRKDEQQHWVRLTQPYYLGTTEVTQAQFEQVMEYNPAFFKRGGEYPVENVAWEEAVTFCTKLSALPRERERNASYRLPTEAEWEYACRAGTTERYYFGDDATWILDYACVSASQPHLVGRRAPNAWGLYDMLGNVWEWCGDWYAEYPADEQQDPRGPGSGSSHVVRGGCWNVSSGLPRTAVRSRFILRRKDNTTGFRVAMDVLETEPAPK